MAKLTVKFLSGHVGLLMVNGVAVSKTRSGAAYVGHPFEVEERRLVKIRIQRLVLARVTGRPGRKSQMVLLLNNRHREVVIDIHVKIPVLVPYAPCRYPGLKAQVYVRTWPLGRVLTSPTFALSEVLP